jgi:hypothetical protein
MKGWITLHRQIENNPLWLSEPFTKAQAWVDLILNANHADGHFFVRGIKVDVKRGQLGWSEITMAKRWRWSREKVRRFLLYLEDECQTRQQKIDKITTITTIINYSKYQDKTTERQQKDNRRDTNNNDNNDNNALSETSSLIKNNNNDMFKRQPDDEAEVVLDYDSGEVIEDPTIKEKEENQKITNNLKVLGEMRDMPFINLPTQRKRYKQLLTLGYTHMEIADEYEKLLDSEYWKKEKKESKRLPDMNSLYSNLSNKIKDE